MMTEQTTTNERTWTEEFEVEAERLVETLKGLAAEGNVRRVIIRRGDDSELLDLPLYPSLAIGGLLVWLWPVAALVVAIAGLVTKVKVQVVRETVSDDL